VKLTEHFFDRSRIGDVANQCGTLRSVRPKTLCGLLESSQVAARHGDGTTFHSERRSNGFADSVATSGYNRRLAFQPHSISVASHNYL
jgi:hypothetical protein